ncbi:MAG: hypothetical protein ACI30M_02585 [Muribaculaceae bacterium]
MMTGLTFDINKVREWLSTLDLSTKEDEVNDILYNSTVFIYSTAQQNLHSQLKERGKNKWGLKLSQGLARGAYKNTQTAKVFVKTSNRYNPTNGNYIVYMNAKGTEERFRKTKNGGMASTGRLQPKPFLKDAVSSQLNNTYKYINDEILKLLEK